MAEADSQRIAELREKWEADPSSRAYLQLADEYLKLGDLSEAASVLRQGLEERPGDLSGQVALGRCLVELGESEEAVGRLEAVLERDPAHIVANKLLIRAYLGAGRPEPARERLEIHRLLDDRDVELGELERALNRVAGAGSSPTLGEEEGEGLRDEEQHTHEEALQTHEEAVPSPRKDEAVPVAGADARQAWEQLGGADRAAETWSPPEAESVGESASGEARSESVDDSGGAAERPEPVEAPAEDSRPAPDRAEGSPIFPLPPLEAPVVPTSRRSSRGARRAPFDLEPLPWAAPGADLFGLAASSREALPGRDAEGVGGVGEIQPEEHPETPSAAVAEVPDSKAEELTEPDEPSGPPEVESTPGAEHEEAAFFEEPGKVEDRELPAEETAATAAEAPVEVASETPIFEAEAEEGGDEPEAPADALEAEEPVEVAREGEVLHSEETAPAEKTPAIDRVPPAEDREPADEAATGEPGALEEAAESAADRVPAGTVTLGELYLRQGHLDEAESIFGRIVAEHPENIRARWGLRRVRAARPSPLAADLLLERSEAEGPPEGLTAKKIQVLDSYIDHLRRGDTDHVH